jgi:ankyrin repeat protein
MQKHGMDLQLHLPLRHLFTSALQLYPNIIPLYTLSPFSHPPPSQSPRNASPFLTVCNSDGETPLYEAARYGHLAVVQALIAANADPNATNRYVFCSLIFRALTSAHVLCNCISTLFLYARCPLPSCLSPIPLLNASPFLTVCNSGGEAPLHFAAKNLAVVQALIAANANPQARDRCHVFSRV